MLFNFEKVSIFIPMQNKIFSRGDRVEGQPPYLKKALCIKLSVAPLMLKLVVFQANEAAVPNVQLKNRFFFFFSEGSLDVAHPASHFPVQY